MKLEDYPTTLTDEVMTDPLRDGNDLPELCRKLERKLAMCRERLKKLMRGSLITYAAKNQITETLEETK